MTEAYNNSKISENMEDKSKIDESIIESNAIDEDYSDFDNSKQIED
jgi:hypothetical protein